MAESLKTILMSALASKATPAESDTLIVGEGNVLKKISFSQLFTYLKDKLGINTLNTNISNLMQISSDTIKDIDVPASGSVMITFTKFKPKSGYNRVVLAHSFNNSSNGGSNYSGMFIYNTTGATDGIQVFIHNVWSSKGKVNLSLTVAYIQSNFFN